MVFITVRLAYSVSREMLYQLHLIKRVRICARNTSQRMSWKVQHPRLGGEKYSGAGSRLHLGWPWKCDEQNAVRYDCEQIISNTFGNHACVHDVLISSMKSN